MRVVVEKDGQILALPTKELPFNAFKSIKSRLAYDILNIVSKQESYPLAIAKKLSVNEQAVYYHVRNLEKAGLIKRSRQETKQGVLTNYYSLAHDSFLLKFNEFKPVKSPKFNKSQPLIFEPFVSNGELNATIVLGSPHSHGPDRAKARDGALSTLFAMFLGTFVESLSNVKIVHDTELKKEDLNDNLIVIGGPVVNKITSLVNKHLPIYFDQRKRWSLVHRKSREIFSEDECGLIAKLKNPFNKNKKILVIGGKRYEGTRAAVIAVTKHFDKFKHFKKNFAVVVEGLDLDYDSVVDAVEFKKI